MGYQNKHATQKGSSNGLTDEKLVALASTGNTDALDELISRYKNLVRARSRSYFLVGADSDDIIQEGMIGLFKAIRDFNSAKQTVFSAFAELCITRQIMTAIKTATRNKHLPLNTYISLNRPLYEEDPERSLIDIVSEESSFDPEELVLLKERMATIEELIKTELSPFEQNVLSFYLDGCSYQEISVKLETHVKSVDNALQRIKRKLAKSKTSY